MGGALVSETELCWVLGAIEPAMTGEIASYLPIKHLSASVRLRSLERRGYVTHESVTTEEGRRYRWTLTDRGRALVDEADLPPAAETDFEEYFAGRTNTLDSETLLRELAAHDEEWVPSSALYDVLPYSKTAIRYNLHDLQEKGAVDVDEGDVGQVHHWRVTDQGRDCLAEAEDVDPSAAPS